jgi:hypothetical protein
MSRKVTVTYTVTYDLRKGEVADEYLEQLDDYKDTRSQREWFAIDRFIGHNNLVAFDEDAKLTVKESR